MIHENIFWLSLHYNMYNLYRITWFCNKNKKPRTDPVALIRTFFKISAHANNIPPKRPHFSRRGTVASVLNTNTKIENTLAFQTSNKRKRNIVCFFKLIFENEKEMTIYTRTTFGIVLRTVGNVVYGTATDHVNIAIRHSQLLMLKDAFCLYQAGN